MHIDIKVLKKITVFVAVCISIFLITVNICFADNKVTPDDVDNNRYVYGHFVYRIDDNDEIHITQFGHDIKSWDQIIDEIIIPNEIEGKKVVGVDHNILQFPRYEDVKSIVCSDYMETVDMQSFNGAKNLELLELGKYAKHFKIIGYEGNLHYPGAHKHGYLCDYSIKISKSAEFLKVSNGSLYSKDGLILYRPHEKTKIRGFKIQKNTRRIYKNAFLASPYTVLKLNNRIKKIDKGVLQNSSIQLIKVPKRSRKRILKVLRKSGITKSFFKYRPVKYY